MKYIILFTDNPNADQDIRACFMPDHLRFLKKNQDSVLSAGPLKNINGDVSGGLWLVDVESAEQAQELVEEDPFWPTGLRDKVEVKQWVQVFADGKTLI